MSEDPRPPLLFGEPGTPPGDPEQPQPRRRPWLLPVSIIVGAALIAAAIIVVGTRDDGDETPDAGGFSEAGDGPRATSARAAFEAYADELGINVDEFSECLAAPEAAARINAALDAGVANGVTGTPTFFVNNKLVMGAQPIAIFEEIIENELGGTPPESLDEYSPAIHALVDEGRFAILDEKPAFEHLKVEGDAGAPVTIVEFSDFQCPFCREFAATTMPSLRERAGDEVSFAFAHFPLVQIHPNAGRAALAAECADEQGAFWGMHDLLFQRQQAWQDLP